MTSDSLRTPVTPLNRDPFPLTPLRVTVIRVLPDQTLSSFSDLSGGIELGEVSEGGFEAEFFQTCRDLGTISAVLL